MCESEKSTISPAVTHHRGTAHGSLLMAVTLALVWLGALTSSASAGRVILSGTYSKSQIDSACQSNGGVSTSFSGGYGCQGTGGTVSCNKQGKCYGECSNCGTRQGGGKTSVSGIIGPAPGGAVSNNGANTSSGGKTSTQAGGIKPIGNANRTVGTSSPGTIVRTGQPPSSGGSSGHKH